MIPQDYKHTCIAVFDYILCTYNGRHNTRIMRLILLVMFIVILLLYHLVSLDMCDT